MINMQLKIKFDSTTICRQKLFFKSSQITKFKYWITDLPNWSKFKSDEEKNERQRILVQLDGCCIGIGETGLFRLSYGFSAQVNTYIKISTHIC